MNERIMLARDNRQDFQFVGELVAAAAAGDHPSRQVYSLYVTKAGTYVAGIRKEVYGKTESCEAYRLGDKNEVVEYFGFSNAAKELYAEAGINTAIWID